jgi:DNA-binding NtrC family response regulator
VITSANYQRIAVPRQSDSLESHRSSRPTVLLATNDPEIRENIAELLQFFPLKTVWAKGMEEVKSVIVGESVAVCLCGFWLVDGTYRDVVRHLKSQRVEIPAVIVCAPACPHEYSEYLAALKIKAFDFICHPYLKTDMERILRSAIEAHNGSERATLPLAAPLIPTPGVSGLRRAS